MDAGVRELANSGFMHNRAQIIEASERPGYSGCVELLERERELAAIEALLAQGGVLVIEGGAGIGKTSLLEAAGSRAAEEGDEILRARGSELEAGFVLSTVTAQRHGRALSTPEVHCWRLVDGKAVEFREFQGDQQAEDEFWLS